MIFIKWLYEGLKELLFGFFFFTSILNPLGIVTITMSIIEPNKNILWITIPISLVAFVGWSMYFYSEYLAFKETYNRNNNEKQTF